MSKAVLYLKYRPFQLSEVVGQDFIVQTLRKASQDNSFVHAYLFGGIKGCGKTSMARILANLLTCENSKDGVLCRECKACKSIRAGTATDIVELDGAKNGKVEHVQELINGAQWTPANLKRKIYIIDEAHQLTPRAISALLKIVEEPPSYLSFIFCTTEVNKIPDTILSRSQRFVFRKIQSRDIVGRLRYIADRESIQITDEALGSIARLGRGSLRDAIGYLEQIATIGAGNKITDSSICKYFSVIDRQALFNIIGAIKSCNVPLLMDQVNDMVMASADTESVLYELSELLRSAMVISAQRGETKLIDLPDVEIEKLTEFTNGLKLGHLTKVAGVFASTKQELEYGINSRWVMESNLIKCAALLQQ
jgi:DNA polymerase-3 subunit gamma/tau